MKHPCPSWVAALKESVRKLETGDYPVWWDGFANVLVNGQNAADNTYDQHHEACQYREYRAGALAAESLMHSIGLEVRHG